MALRSPSLSPRGSSEAGAEMQIKRTSSKVVITDEMMLKAVSMANGKDKVESTIRNRITPEGSNTDANGNCENEADTKIQGGERTCLIVEDQVEGPSPKDDKAVIKYDDTKGGNKSSSKLSYENKCPFEIICDFLQAIMKKKYDDALRYCTQILLFEPGNEIANEFRDVLLEMVGEVEDKDEVHPATTASEAIGDGQESECSESSSSESETDADADEDEGGDGDADYDTSITSDSSISDEAHEGGGGGDALEKFFSISSASSNNDSEEDEDDDESCTDTSSETSSESSSSSSTEEENIVSITDNDNSQAEGFLPLEGNLLLWDGMVHGENKHNQTKPKYYNEDDTYDMISSLQSLDVDTDNNSIYSGAHIEDLGEVEDVDCAGGGGSGSGNLDESKGTSKRTNGG